MMPRLASAEHAAIHRATKDRRNYYARLRRRYSRSSPDVLPIATSITVSATTVTTTMRAVMSSGGTVPPVVPGVRLRLGLGRGPDGRRAVASPDGIGRRDAAGADRGAGARKPL